MTDDRQNLPNEIPPDLDREAAPLHVAGAGTIGLIILLVSLSMLFLASIVALLVIRSQAIQWPPPGFPPVPRSLWLSTFVILFASVFVQLAHNAIRRDDQSRLTRWLAATFVVGLLFLALQTFNWVDFVSAMRARGIEQVQGAYLGMFFVLTGLHAAHVVGGLIPLGIVWAHAARGTARYSRNYHPGVRYLAAYWHFLDIIWIILFLVIYF